jgi:hypothetical protein
MGTKEALLEARTIHESFLADYRNEMIPTAIYLLKSRIVAVEWFVENWGGKGHQYFIDDENIASVAHRIEIKN